MHSLSHFWLKFEHFNQFLTVSGRGKNKTKTIFGNISIKINRDMVVIRNK